MRPEDSRKDQRLSLRLFCCKGMSLFTLMAFLVSTNSFSLERRRLPGIWKLTSDSLPYEQDIRSKLKGLLPEAPQHEILIKVNADGSFKQCNEGYREGRWMSGKWELSEEKILVLAMRRQYYGPQFDVLLEGSITNDEPLTVKGQVLKGKFMLGLGQPSFFDQPLAKKDRLGPFILEQSLSYYAITGQGEKEVKEISENLLSTDEDDTSYDNVFE